MLQIMIKRLIEGRISVHRKSRRTCRSFVFSTRSKCQPSTKNEANFEKHSTAIVNSSFRCSKIFSWKSSPTIPYSSPELRHSRPIFAISEIKNGLKWLGTTEMSDSHWYYRSESKLWSFCKSENPPKKAKCKRRRQLFR